MIATDASGDSAFDGRQDGWYLESVYKFKRQWRTGLRYDRLASHNGSGATIAAAGLDGNGFQPHRWSAMVEWSPSEFSRIRLQYNRDDSTRSSDDQVILQYTQALGSHGAHSY